MEWVEMEMETAQLGDQRLNERAKVILQRLVSQPSASLPTALRGWSETQAAYRFFSNGKVTAERVLKPHRDATRERMKEHPTVLCIEDTSELDYTGKSQTEGLGPLTYESRHGMYLHPTLAVTPERLCLGALAMHTWAREKDREGEEKKHWEKRLEEKESVRWIDGYRRVCELAREVPGTQCVYMADRESDIYELFAEGYAQGHSADWLIRASHDRRLLDEDAKLSAVLASADVLGEIAFELPAGHERAHKQITQRLKAVRVELQPPPRRNGEKLEPLEVTVLVAEESHPPKGESPVTWVLLTNLKITTLEQAIEKIQWYLCRWQIEIYFRILKSGCKIEELQLEHIDRLRPAIAMYMIVAWRVLYLTMLGRECPDISCDVVFDAQEWQAIYIVSERKPPPDEPPPLNIMLRMLASFGGFLNRKHDGEPGPQSVWIGLQRTRDFVLALEAQKSSQGDPYG